ncbi:MAG: hypothetical protein AAF512_20100 [Pseudomonadota bacterium]
MSKLLYRLVIAFSVAISLLMAPVQADDKKYTPKEIEAIAKATVACDDKSDEIEVLINQREAALEASTKAAKDLQDGVVDDVSDDEYNKLKNAMDTAYEKWLDISKKVTKAQNEYKKLEKALQKLRKK